MNKLKLFYLIITGELIFALPFHINRFFRPALLEDYNYSNSMIGVAFTTYGLTALICYFPGGYIADKFDTRKLLALSLGLTSLGGIMLLFYPNFYFLCFIYGYWGVTSILFCWSALIKATRLVGSDRQGLSFGILEAGRGLIASLLATIAALIYSNEIIEKIFINSFFFYKFTSLSLVILFYTIITFVAAIIILVFYKTEANNKKNFINFKSIIILKKYYKLIFFQSIIVFTAYSAYKGIDYYSQFFYEILNYSKEKSAIVMSNLSYLRPICAVLAGIIADKYTVSKSTFSMFLISSISFLLLALYDSNTFYISFILINIVVTMMSVFALRGIYFSFLKELKIPTTVTGIAVGIISLIGYFPDIYIGPLFGYFLDQNETIILGFKNCFKILFIMMLIGTISSYILILKNNNKK